jgi:hypothetical protein
MPAVIASEVDVAIKDDWGRIISTIQAALAGEIVGKNF